MRSAEADALTSEARRARAIRAGCLAIALVSLASHAWARDAKAPAWTASNCDVAPMRTARAKAHALFDKGDVTGAAARLSTIVSSWPESLPDCLGTDSAHVPLVQAFSPDGEEQQVLNGTLSGRQAAAAETYAWLLNDLVLYMTDGRNRSASDGMACYRTVSTLFDKDVNPLPWLGPRLSRAAVANLRACGKTCIRSECALPRSQVWARFDSQAGLFASHPCTENGGQEIGPRTCLGLEPPQATATLADMDRPQAELRRFCPNVVLRRRAAVDSPASETLALADTSKLYDPSNCCFDFKITTDPKSRRFMLSGSGRDCFGGTAQFAVEEIYSLDAAGRPSLVKDNSAGFH